MSADPWVNPPPEVMPDPEDYDDNGDCPNCGGEGFVADCFEEWACLDPESGCDLCTHRCDWCNRPTPPKAEGDQ